MNDLAVEFDSTVPEFVAGTVLRGRVLLTARLRGAGLAVSVFARWLTEGKGDPSYGDGAVCALVVPAPPPVAVPFALALPEEPWSYSGRLIKIHWQLRAVALAGTERFEVARDFVLGSPALVARPRLHYR